MIKKMNVAHNMSNKSSIDHFTHKNALSLKIAILCIKCSTLALYHECWQLGHKTIFATKVVFGTFVAHVLSYISFFKHLPTIFL